MTSGRAGRVEVGWTHSCRLTTMFLLLASVEWPGSLDCFYLNVVHLIYLLGFYSSLNFCLHSYVFFSPQFFFLIYFSESQNWLVTTQRSFSAAQPMSFIMHWTQRTWPKVTRTVSPWGTLCGSLVSVEFGLEWMWLVRQEKTWSLPS